MKKSVHIYEHFVKIVEKERKYNYNQTIQNKTKIQSCMIKKKDLKL